MLDQTKEIPDGRGLFWLPAFLLISCGFVLSFFTFSPGLMSYDLFSMYNQAVIMEFNDWHHPFLPLLMVISRAISGDTSLLLFFQLFCSWTGVYLFAVSLRHQIGSWAILFILISFTPIILSYSGFLGKTSLQTAMFLLVFGACYYFYSYPNSRSLLIQLLLLIPLFLGTTIRSYSYVSAIPIVMFWSYIVLHKYFLKLIFVKCFIVTVLILLVFVITEKLIINHLIIPEKSFKSAILFEYDLAGIMAKSGEIYAEKLLIPSCKTPEGIKKHYEKYNGMWLIITMFGRDKNRKGRANQNIFKREDLQYLFREWITAVLDNPSAYLKHRYHAIATSFGFNEKGKKIQGLRYDKPWRNKINKHNLQKKDSLAWQVFKKYNKKYEKTILFKPWLWFCLNIIVFIISLVLVLKRNFCRLLLPHFVLVSSGTLFYILYLFIGLSVMGRFVYWGTVATVFSMFGIFASTAMAYCRYTVSPTKNV